MLQQNQPFSMRWVLASMAVYGVTLGEKLTKQM